MGIERTRRLLLMRRLRRLGDAALELVWPTRCVGCERLGVLLCERCWESLPCIDQAFACPRCGAPAGKLVCTECTTLYEKTDFAFTQARCALEFSELTRRLIIAYKDGGERRLAPVLAALLADAIPLEWRRWADALSWIPADERALRRRGFDHMELIARELAARAGLRLLPTLIKYSRADQRRLGRMQRRDNTSALFSARKTVQPQSQSQSQLSSQPQHQLQSPSHPQSQPPRRLLLIDDVFTTGATLDAATRVLLAAGFHELRVATVARVW